MTLMCGINYFYFWDFLHESDRDEECRKKISIRQNEKKAKIREYLSSILKLVKVNSLWDFFLLLLGFIWVELVIA